MKFSGNIVPLTKEWAELAAELGQLTMHRTMERSTLAESFFQPSNRYFAAIENGTFLGFGGYSFALDQGDVVEIAVSVGARRRGVARALLTALLADAVASGVKSLFLEVRASNTAAIALYTALGFRKTGERKNYYTSPREDAVLMCLHLLEE